MGVYELVFVLGWAVPGKIQGPAKITCPSSPRRAGQGMRDFLPHPIPRTGPRICGAPFPVISGAPLLQVLLTPCPFPIPGPRIFWGPAQGPRRGTIQGPVSQGPGGAPQWGPVVVVLVGGGVGERGPR